MAIIATFVFLLFAVWVSKPPPLRTKLERAGIQLTPFNVIRDCDLRWKDVEPLKRILRQEGFDVRLIWSENGGGFYHCQKPPPFYRFWGKPLVVTFTDGIDPRIDIGPGL